MTTTSRMFLNVHMALSTSPWGQFSLPLNESTSLGMALSPALTSRTQRKLLCGFPETLLEANIHARKHAQPLKLSEGLASICHPSPSRAIRYVSEGLLGLLAPVRVATKVTPATFCFKCRKTTQLNPEMPHQRKKWQRGRLK